MSIKEKEDKSDILSLKSDLLDDEMRLLKRKNENFAYLVCILNQFIWAIQGLQLKTYHLWFPKIYTINSFIFWRNIGLVSLGYIMCKSKNMKIKKPNEIKNKLWFYSYMDESTFNFSSFKLSNCRRNESFINNNNVDYNS